MAGGASSSESPQSHLPLWVPWRAAQEEQIHGHDLQIALLVSTESHNYWPPSCGSATGMAMRCSAHIPPVCSRMCHTPWKRGQWSCWEFVLHVLSCLSLHKKYIQPFHVGKVGLRVCDTLSWILLIFLFRIIVVGFFTMSCCR